MNRRQVMEGMNRRMEYDIKGQAGKGKDRKVMPNKEKSTGSVETFGVLYENVGVGRLIFQNGFTKRNMMCKCFGNLKGKNSV